MRTSYFFSLNIILCNPAGATNRGFFRGRYINQKRSLLNGVLRVVSTELSLSKFINQKSKQVMYFAVVSLAISP